MKKKAANIDHGKSYDSYYNSDNSIYKQLYKDEVIAYDKYIIESQVQKLIGIKQKKNPDDKNISIVDYGCGDGRFLKVYQEIALDIKERYGFSLKVIGYDPSLNGLTHFSEKLIKSSFIKMDGFQFRRFADVEGGSEKDNLSYSVGGFFKDNLAIELIHGHVEDEVSHITSLLGKVDLTLMMFCVLSHVIGRDKRVDLLKGLDDISTKIFFSVPGPGILGDYQHAFKVLRDNKVETEITAVASEDGDIIYTRNDEGDSGVQNYMHIYQSSKQLREELMLANVEDKSEVGINKIFHETHLINHPWLSEVDKYFTMVVNKVVPYPVLDSALSISSYVNYGYEKVSGYHHLFGSYYGVLVSDIEEIV